MRLVRSAALAFLLLGCGAGAQESAQESSAAEIGAELFHSTRTSESAGNVFACSDCHAESGGSTGRILPGADLDGALDRVSYWGGHEDDLLRSINDCRTYFMRSARAWSADDDDARAVYAYLATRPGGSVAWPFAIVRDIVPPPCEPADAAAGRTVFEQACEHCHGTVHDGRGRRSSLVPILPDEVLYNHDLRGRENCDSISQVTAAAIFSSKIRHGVFFREDGTMPPFSEEALSDSALADLFEFLGLGPSH